jgi:hypothetical protein
MKALFEEFYCYLGELIAFPGELLPFPKEHIIETMFQAYPE